jgi:hypothetical protein
VDPVLAYFHICGNIEACQALSFFLSTYFRELASYTVGRFPKSGNGCFFGFDRFSAAWDNFCFWGYDDLL